MESEIKKESRRAIQLACEAVGGQIRLVEGLAALRTPQYPKGVVVTPQAVNQWLRKGRVPSKQILAVEAVTGVSRHLLRRDVFGPARRKPAARTRLARLAANPV